MSLEAKERGPEVSLQGALLITGVALAYWVDFGFVQVPNQIWVSIKFLMLLAPPNRPFKVHLDRMQG